MLEERKVQKAKITLMRHPKFALLQGILMVGKTRIADNLPTACTNGRDEIYGREFVRKLRDPELAFVIAHEAGHKMYRHMTTWTKLHAENPQLTNQACDYVINLMLKDLDPTENVIAMPMYRDGPHAGKKMGLIDERFRGMNTKQVYDILKQEQKDGEGGGGDGDGIDDHDWDGAKELTDEQKKELARDIDQAIRQGLMAHQKINGKGAGGLDRELQDLMEPKVNWREELREYVKAICRAKDTSSWRRVNRRFLSTGIYMPSMVGEKVGHIVVGIDTSGSIGGPELAEFLSEVKGIAEEVNPEKVDLIYWDSEVAAHEEYADADVANIVSSTKPKGGGGTSPSCMSEYLKEKKIVPECIIVLTDGYVGNDWGSDWTAPVMWAITGGNTSVASNGKTIHIKD
jgi:predicted metal-dependent peptidase